MRGDISARCIVAGCSRNTVSFWILSRTTCPCRPTYTPFEDFFQRPPSAQTKLIWVGQGSVQDVIVDIRHSSPTYGQHLSIELSANNGFQLLVPSGFAHGFLTTAPDTMVHYKTNAYYAPEHDIGLLWNDPDLEIKWKCHGDTVVLSERDRKLTRLKELPPYFP